MTSIIIGFALAVAAALFFIVKSSIVAASKAKMADIPEIFDKLKATGKDANFAVFCFGDPATSSAREAVNVQFSIEGSKMGFDWVLLGPLNIRDKDKFTLLGERLGHKVVACERNGVKYLRVEDGDLPKLCKASIRDLYNVASDTELRLIPRGFKWP